jgi:hypothetical protein
MVVIDAQAWLLACKGHGMTMTQYVVVMENMRTDTIAAALYRLLQRGKKEEREK